LAYLAASSEAWGPPLYFSIETINTCNLRCVYCPQSRRQDHFVNGRGRLSLKRFDIILDRLEEAFRPRRVSLHRDGEPLLNPEIDRYVRRATERGIVVTFSSNGALMTPERARGLLDAGLRMLNSDFCADASRYESLRVGAKWARTYEGLCQVLEAAETTKARFRLIIKDLDAGGPSTARTREALEATRLLFQAHAKRVVVVPVHFHNALQKSAQDLSIRDDAGDPPSYNLCHQPWVSMTVDWAGRIVACCRDLRSEYVLGNLLEQPAWNIWNGEPMRRLRQALARRRPQDISVCSTCDLPWRGSYSGRTKAERVGKYLFSKNWKE
jgi:radical SAM protein with 4Fe4S-binding SPASM domain